MISTERSSAAYSLLLNSCGIEQFFGRRGHCLRPKGRVDYHILYIHSGACHVHVGDAWHAAEVGSIVLFRPGERQEYRFQPEDQSISYYIHFTGRDCETILKRLNLWQNFILPMGKSKEFEAVFEKMLLEYTMKRPAFEDACASYLLQLLVLISRRHAPMESGVQKEQAQKIEQVLMKMYDSLEKELSITELAKSCYMSVGHFCHLFKNVVGISPHGYMAYLRIEKAKDLLANTDRSVAEISAATGFSDQNYFSRYFKKRTGYSPSEYRKSK